MASISNDPTPTNNKKKEEDPMMKDLNKLDINRMGDNYGDKASINDKNDKSA